LQTLGLVACLTTRHATAFVAVAFFVFRVVTANSDANCLVARPLQPRTAPVIAVEDSAAEVALGSAGKRLVQCENSQGFNNISEVWWPVLHVQAALIAVHGRERGGEDKRRDGAADLDQIAAVVRALQSRTPRVPCLSNGNVRVGADCVDNLATTGAQGLMVAEHLLRNPSLFGVVADSTIDYAKTEAHAAVDSGYQKADAEADAVGTGGDGSIVTDIFIGGGSAAEASGGSAAETCGGDGAPTVAETSGSLRDSVVVTGETCGRGANEAAVPLETKKSRKAKRKEKQHAKGATDAKERLLKKKAPLQNIDGGRTSREVVGIADEYLRLVLASAEPHHSDGRPLLLHDGAVYGPEKGLAGTYKWTRMTRPPPPESVANEFERLSVWWPNADTVKTHIRCARCFCLCYFITRFCSFASGRPFTSQYRPLACCVGCAIVRTSPAQPQP
jgi:tRNA-dihydrouridine synthase